MSGHRLFGIETEYAVAAVNHDGTVWPTSRFNEALLRRACQRLVHLPATGGGGIFLSNGSRLYVDCGEHPEIGSPECLDPRDVVRYARAGDRLLLQLAGEVQRDHQEIAETVVRTGNVDYSIPRATWGAHESYCHRSTPGLLRRRLVPHLVSRVVYAGAGGFNPFSPGLEFMLSPRAVHIVCEESGDSTGNRGIVHTREEPLAAAYRRQHVLCGESLRSDLAAWLRIGATALVVALIDHDIACGDDVALAHPIEALAVSARDTTCRRRVATASGPMTAVQIQRRYLDAVGGQLGAAWMPAWAPDLCARWDEVLSRLERGPEACDRCLDWAIKLAVYRDRARRHGFEWVQLPAWTQVVERRQRHLRGAPGVDAPGEKPEPSPEARARAEASVLALARRHGLRLADLERFLSLRHELLEVDVRFGQLGPRSVFEGLDASGVLDHRLPDLEPIDHAVDHPPRLGRARLRGEAVRQAQAEPGRYSCTWEYVLDHRTQARLDLADPFAECATWTAIGPPPAPTQPAGAGDPWPAAAVAPAAGGDPIEDHAPSDEAGLVGRLLARIRRPTPRRARGDASDRARAQ